MSDSTDATYRQMLMDRLAVFSFIPEDGLTNHDLEAAIISLEMERVNTRGTVPPLIDLADTPAGAALLRAVGTMPDSVSTPGVEDVDVSPVSDEPDGA